MTATCSKCDCNKSHNDIACIEVIVLDDGHVALKEEYRYSNGWNVYPCPYFSADANHDYYELNRVYH